MKKSPKSNISELSWTRADYMTNNTEVPAGLVNDNIHTEGELMSEDEVMDWISDTEKTFSVIKESDEKVFEKLYQQYVIDIHYLCEIGKITEEDADEILRLERFEF